MKYRIDYEQDGWVVMKLENLWDLWELNTSLLYEATGKHYGALSREMQ